MRVMTAKQQTLFLSLVNALVRGLGLVMRVLLSRLLGAEIVGLTELASGVHMLLITPLTSGLPLAVSRLTALNKGESQPLPLVAGKKLVRWVSLALIPVYLILSPQIAKLLGDVRVLPSLWVSAPCLMILGFSAIYNGYCFGTERVFAPAWSELIEQIVRFILCFTLLTLLPSLTAPWKAAVPMLGTMLAELAGLVFVVCALRIPKTDGLDETRFLKPLVRLSLPTTGTRLVGTGLRSLNSVLIPLRLQASGLSMAEATARFGMLSGMVMPVALLPCVFTGALGVVAIPRLTKAERDRKQLTRLTLLFLGSCLTVGVVGALLVWLLAPVMSVKMYRQPELTGLFQLAAPLVVLSSVSHITASIVAGLGKQKHAFTGVLISSAVTAACNWLLTGFPLLRLKGAMIALGVGQAITLIWNLAIVLKHIRLLKRGEMVDASQLAC